MTAKLNPRSARKHLQDFRFSDLSDEDLANLVTALHRDDRLVVVNLHDEPAKEPRILCSLGLKERLHCDI
jgi:hypothetical protein